MNTSRKIAIAVGVLFIVGTVAGVLSALVSLPLLDAPDFLAQIAANEGQFIMATLLVLVMGMALALVPIIAYPVLKQHNQTLAMGYVVFRGALETAIYLVMVIEWLFLLLLGREYSVAGAPDAAYFQTLGVLLKDGNELMSSVLAIVFSLGALMLYAIFYQSKLIPRWLSVWGVAAILLHFVTSFLLIFGLQSLASTSNSLMNLPIFLQEMVMAVWLIAKGFNLAAIAPASTTETTQ